ncbi:protein FAM205C-like isoform X3 [Microtus ochrogaster]|uniref:Protein FAM205C-like isoform X3 n=1 Tax=Microtus ochrogaster TaxID=79684 RepID=A0ABM0LA96_MICOH|nr:protein FAM205C-like isoform X3 [Microtus ochrogaster]
MLDPNFILWDVGYPLYKYGSIFIIALIIWHVKRSYQGLRLGPDKSCYKCYRRIKHGTRDRTPKAKRTSKEEAEKLQKLLTIMKSQGWLPQEGSVRRLLCSDPSCAICNAMALEIQQLLGYENKETCLTTLSPSQTFSSLEALASSKVLFDKSSQDSRDISLASSLMPSPSTDQKSSTQSAAPSTGDASFRYYRGDHGQKQEAQGAGSLSSSSVEEPGAPANQQKKKITKLVLKNEEPPEAEGENKMTFFSHWVNPEVNCEQLEEPIVLCKSETEAKPKTAEPQKNPTPVRDHTGANMKSTTEDQKAKPLCAKN